MFENVRETLKALPAATIADEVVASVKEGKVTVLAAPTGSGKSMLVPATLADAVEEQVVVLVPRRFLAIDAASNVAQMAGTQLGNEVGFALGGLSGEKSKFSDKTKLLFVTYGYAISSGLIDKARNIVLDEVHEGAEDISLARAILYDRKKNDLDLRLMEMSATVDARRQSVYWKDVAETQIHSIEGQALACDERRVTPDTEKKNEGLIETVLGLLKEGRKGIAVFLPGIKDVERTVESLEEAVKKAGRHDVQIAGITGDSRPDQRNEARKPPADGKCKIIVGTNVIESGVNLRWVDSGVSNGVGRINYHRPDTGADALVSEDLPQWRIVQQRGRINRDPANTGFESGVFTLYSKREMAHRPQQATMELQRVSPLRIAFRAAALGYDPQNLNFDANIEKPRMDEAKADLLRFGLIDEDWKLTPDGKYAAKLPISPENAAILCEAKRMDIAALQSGDDALKKRPKLLPDAIILAAIAEEGGLREEYQYGHGRDGKSDVHGASDLIDGWKVYRSLERTSTARVVAQAASIMAEGDEDRIAGLKGAEENLKKLCAPLNVDYNAFVNVMQMVAEIRERHADAKSIQTSDEIPDPAHYNGMKQAILNGYSNRLFLQDDSPANPTYRDLLRGARSFPVDPYSALNKSQQSSRTPLVVGTLRELPPKPGAAEQEPEIVLTQPTSIPTEVFIAWANGHYPAVVSEVQHKDGALTGKYCDKASFSVPTPKKPTVATIQYISQLVDPALGWERRETRP